MKCFFGGNCIRGSNVWVRTRARFRRFVAVDGFGGVSLLEGIYGRRDWGVAGEKIHCSGLHEGPSSL